MRTPAMVIRTADPTLAVTLLWLQSIGGRFRDDLVLVLALLFRQPFRGTAVASDRRGRRNFVPCIFRAVLIPIVQFQVQLIMPVLFIVLRIFGGQIDDKFRPDAVQRFVLLPLNSVAAGILFRVFSALLPRVVIVLLRRMAVLLRRLDFQPRASTPASAAAVVRP